ncbi:MAG: hypothetical protein U0235_13100 [Polyangiaceae bacterium]
MDALAVVRLLLTVVVAVAALMSVIAPGRVGAARDVAFATGFASAAASAPTSQEEREAPAAPTEERRDDADPGDDDASDDLVDDVLAAPRTALSLAAHEGASTFAPLALADPPEAEPVVDVPPPRRG